MENASPGKVVSVEVRLGCAFGHAAIGGIIRKEAKLATRRHTGAIASVGIAAGRTSPDTVSSCRIAELIRISGARLDAHLSVVVAEFREGRVALGHAFEEMGVSPRVYRTLLHAKSRAWVAVVSVVGGVVAVAVNHIGRVVSSNANSTNWMAVFVEGGGTNRHAFVGAIGAEVAEGTLCHAEVG